MAPRRTHVDWPALAVVCTALVLRFYALDGQSLWYDEGTSAALATRSFRDIAAGAANDIHPPLYYWLLALWVRLFGDGVVALRSLSALLGTAVVWGVIVVGRRLWRGPAALLAGLFAAVSPYLIWYSQEVRMYILAAALATFLVWITLRLLEHASGQTSDQQVADPRIDWFGWAVLLVLTTSSLLTHYFVGASAVAIANGVAALGIAHAYLTKRQVPWRWLGCWAGVQTAALVVWLLWLTSAWSSVSAWPATSPPFTVVAAATLAAQALYGGIRALPAAALWWPLAALVAALGVTARGPRSSRLSSAQVAVWVALPLIVLWLVSLSRPGWNPKQLIAAAPGFELLLGSGVAQAGVAATAIAASLRGKSPRLLSAAVAGVVAALVIGPRLAGLAAMYSDPLHQRDDYRSVVAKIGAMAGGSDAVVLDAPTQIELFEYYDRGRHTTYPLPLGLDPDATETQQQLKEIASEHENIFGVLWAVDERDPERTVERWLNENRYKVFDIWIGDVRLARWADAGNSQIDSRPETTVNFGGQIALLEAAQSPEPVEPGDILSLSVRWWALQQPEEDYTVFVQMLDDSDRVVAQRDMWPVGGDSATSSWSADPGREIKDLIGLLVPEGTPPGQYRLIIGLYDATTGERLPVRRWGGPPNGMPDAYELPPVRVR